MTRARPRYDCLEPTVEPRWYVVRSIHGAVIEARRLAAGEDLTRVFLAAMIRWIDEGWRVREFSSRTAAFFCDRHAERRMVSIDPTDPRAVPMYGAAHLGRRPDGGD